MSDMLLEKAWEVFKEGIEIDVDMPLAQAKRLFTEFVNEEIDCMFTAFEQMIADNQDSINECKSAYND